MYTPMLIGSRALDYWFGNESKLDLFKRPEKVDWDFICSKTVIESIKDDSFRLDWHDPQTLGSRGLKDYYEGKSARTYIPSVGEITIAPLEMLYILKRSHAWREKGFDKTMAHLWKEGLVKYKPEPQSYAHALLQIRTKLTKKMYPEFNPKLNKTKEEFFDDPVTKLVDHDWLHELYAFKSRPVFMELQDEDTDSVWCSKEKWNDLGHMTRTMCVAEECYVIATERYIIPNDGVYPFKLAYLQALKKVCTTLCSGWFRDWAIDHYTGVLDLFDEKKMRDVLDIVSEEGHLHPPKVM